MSERGKKMIAPVVVTVLTVLYYGFFFVVLTSVLKGFARYFLAIVPAAAAAVTVAVCIQRIKEIKGGEEDDLGKY